MTGIQALVLGIVQGITEFLPISSSGHLVLLERIWHISGGGLLFVTLLHLGTLAAVLVALRDDVAAVIRNPFSWTSRMILLALIPTAIVGAVFEEFFEHLFQTPVTVGFEFVITGIVLWWIDSIPKGHKEMDDIQAADSLWIGALQGIAIVPALSRSGLTIAGGLWRGLDRDTAGRFSFLLSIPAILGATAVQFDDMLETPTKLGGLHLVPAVIGTVAALVAGYIAVKWTLWLLRRAKMRYFAVYVWVLAGFVFADQIFFHHWFPPLW
ncbi:undecaprenyl-diphosphate phosphatase [Alicyclobacillus curvatus]|jgi:undecaprenyl-diphosphatase|nr:undecaprenyl-diphosphate phosphatase [Alicyclobacillus curvatus]